MKKNYFEQVKADVKTWIEDNSYYFNLDEYRGDRESAEEYLNDNLWTDDSITGNGSGSYTFNREEAKENVLNDMDTVIEALKEFCVETETIAEKFLAEDWEYFDVTARCYVLGSAIYEICDELEEQGAFEELEENDDKLESILDKVAAALDDIGDNTEPEKNLETVTA